MAEYLEKMNTREQGQIYSQRRYLPQNKTTTECSFEPNGHCSNLQNDRKHEGTGHSIRSQRSRKIQSARPPVTRVVSLKKRPLNEKGYKDLEHWLTNSNHVYIGRDMTHYVPGAVGSKWQNPFKEQDYPKLDTRLDMYRKHVETTKYDGKLLYEWLEELRGKTLGCWCKPDPCHGDVIIQMLKSKTIPEISSELKERCSDLLNEGTRDSIPSQRSRKIQSARPPVTRIVSVKKRSLNHQEYKDLEHWLSNPNHVYIGRDMTHYVPGAVGSKWQNPFKVDQHGRDTCIEMYKEYIQTDTQKYDGKTLLESLEELQGKTLGCCCSPDPCHGDVIVQLLKSKT